MGWGFTKSADARDAGVLVVNGVDQTSGAAHNNSGC